MSFKEQCEEILNSVDHSNFDSVEGAMSKILDLIEKNGSDSYINTAIEKAAELRDEARVLLKKERENIKKVANENGISLAEIGMKEESEKDDVEKIKVNKSEEEIRDINQENKVPQTEGKCCILL